MIPMAPALETALASWALAIQPIGACTMGTSMPSISVTRFENMTTSNGAPPADACGESP